MRKIRITIISLLVLFALLVNFGTASAVPPLPSSFYGKVSLNGSNLPEGTVIEAIINDKMISESQTLIYSGDSVFAIDINGDDPSTGVVEGGKENDVIRFRVGGLMAKETGTWHSGTNVELNLTITATNTPQPPEPTRTPVPTQTNIVQPTQIPTARPTQTPKPNPTTAAPAPTTQSITPQLTSVVVELPATEITQQPTSQEVNQTEISSDTESETPASLPTQQDSTQAAYLLTKGENGTQSQQKTQQLLLILALCLLIVIAGILLARYLLKKRSKNQNSKPK
jgi:hypothetical protein